MLSLVEVYYSTPPPKSYVLLSYYWQQHDSCGLKSFTFNVSQQSTMARGGLTAGIMKWPKEAL